MNYLLITIIPLFALLNTQSIEKTEPATFYSSTLTCAFVSSTGFGQYNRYEVTAESSFNPNIVDAAKVSSGSHVSGPNGAGQVTKVQYEIVVRPNTPISSTHTYYFGDPQGDPDILSEVKTVYCGSL
jgi:hypothetical protein